MAANAKSIMRPSSSGRFQPFVAICLFIALVILGYSYWSLSARSSEQVNEITVLESELRLANAKKTSAEKRSDTVSEKVKELESEINKLKLEISTHKEAVQKNGKLLEDLQQQKSILENQLKVAHDELKTIKMETLPAAIKERDEKIAELKQAQDKLQEIQKAPCEESKCQTFVSLARDKLLDSIRSSVGVEALKSLRKAGVDIGKYEAEVKLEMNR